MPHLETAAYRAQSAIGALALMEERLGHLMAEQNMASRTISSDCYGIALNPRSESGAVPVLARHVPDGYCFVVPFSGAP